MKSKQFISMLVSVLMLCSIFGGLTASADTNEQATVNGANASVGDTVTIDYFLKSDCTWEDFQGHITYDDNGLQLESFEMPDVTTGVMTNTLFKGFVYYTGVDISSNYKFSNEVNFYRATFTILKAGSYNVNNIWVVADGNGEDSIVVNNGDDTGTILNPDRLITREVVTVTPKPTEPTTVTTEPTTVTTEPTTVTTEPTTVTTEPTTVTTEPTTATTEPTTVTTEPTTVTTEPTTESTTINTLPSTTQPTKPVVKKVSKISLNKKSVILVKGKSMIVTATVTPKDATNKKLKWTTSNSKVATVNASGKITAKGKGTATIKVTSTDGSNKYATLKVTVKQPVTSVKLNKKSANLKLKGKANQKTVTLKATVSPKNANNKAVAWKSSKTKVATVNSKGKVTAKKKGTCYIIATARDGSKKLAKCKITVK